MFVRGWKRAWMKTPSPCRSGRDAQPERRGDGLVLNKENKVEQRVLTTSGTIGNDWLVTSGLQATA
jgi:hypothetical protein